MLTRKSWIFLAVIGFAGAVYVSPGFAKKSRSSNQAPPPAPTAPAPPAVSPQMTQDRAAEAAASDELTKDKQALKDITDADWGKYAQTPEWTAADAKLNDAQKNLDMAKKTASDALSNNADYQAAVAAKKAAVDALADARTNGNTSPETLSPLANASLQASMQIRKIQTDVLTNDPNVQTATDAVTAAQHDEDLLKAKFQQALSADAQYAAAKTAMDTAQANYTSAQAKTVADHGT